MNARTVQKLRHTRGRTFKISGRLLRNGQPINLETVVIESQLRDGPNLMATCTTVVIDAALGQYSLVVPVADQAAWPLKALRMDVKYTFVNGDVIGTKVFYVEVDSGVTE